MWRNFAIFVAAVTGMAVFSPAPVRTEQAGNAAIIDQIRREGMENSQIMDTVHYLTDRYGPRLTGSPNQKAASEWAVRRMLEWGFDTAYSEFWDFGHDGWANEHLSAHIVEPVHDALVVEALAWTPGTDGPVAAEAYHLVVPTSRDADGDTLQPTQQELTRYFDDIRDEVRGKIVLVGNPAVIPVDFDPPAKRRDDDQVRQSYDPNRPRDNRGGGRGNRGNGPDADGPRRLTGAAVAEQLDAFLLENQVPVRINDAGRAHGQIRAFNHRAYDVTRTVPTVVMRNEDFGRIARLLDRATPVRLEFNIVNRTYPEGRTAYNAFGEIMGSDLRDEVVMLGGHLDSWHSATGATDNAIGCAVMMEAARILKAIGVQPRRTIRVALWSGEEQGLLGSRAYVERHFGTFENPKPDYFKLAGYFNIDAGTGRARGMTVFGPPEAATVLRRAIAPFEDYGVFGAISTSSRNAGGSDHGSFNEAGLPGISVGQDPIEYNSHTWHTNLDTYERIVEEDVKRSAITIAAAVYELAMRDDLLPRFGRESMPARPGN